MSRVKRAGGRLALDEVDKVGKGQAIFLCLSFAAGVRIKYKRGKR